MSGTRKRRDYIIDLERQVSALWHEVSQWRERFSVVVGESDPLSAVARVVALQTELDRLKKEGAR